MCGITGYYYKSGKSINSTAGINGMLELQHHRGPDDAGVRAFSLVAPQSFEYTPGETEQVRNGFEGMLGFNRLSILDLSKNGHQPMCSPDNQVILIFNGEIYNAFDFKDELVADGYRFRSSTDTEVILYLYLKFGFDGMIRRLNGMFGLAIVDLRSREIYIARDRFGIKPVYFFETEEMFAFASEIKSFLSLPEFKPALDQTLLDEYLLFRNSINKTLFRGVSCLEPGTFKVYSPGKKVETRQYFDINDYTRQQSDSGSARISSDLRANLKKSVDRQLISDVKLGCQLSGGIDSSLVTYFAKEIKQDDRLETISIIFEDPFFNEEPYMDHVTAQLGLISHKFQLDASFYLKSFERSTWHFEGPLNHPNTIGIYLLSQKAKAHVTVLLSGEGADEVFGGYSRFANTYRPFKPRTVLSSLKKYKETPVRHLLSYLSEDYRAIMGSAYMTPALAAALKKDFSMDVALANRKNIYNALGGSVFDKQVKYEIKTYLPDLLIRQDKMSMAASIENRVPFLDNDLVERSFTIPEHYLIGEGGQTKFELKKMAAGIFGDKFAYRSKGGFGIPVRNFFADKEFSAYLMDDIIPSISGRGLFDGKVVQGWLQKLQHISSAELDALWIMIAFEAWAKKFKV
ncbi:asparagine synthase (glutamine-hydrolyzing) [Fulvivirgaceae bacterium PWU4]|uniref:asparagine synthase (glutamine-hydrolyzing) n=1 Tax=Chryseosolibacter histidini TaxID=2782349 RepID=A0AAP2GSB6_9BACT|nr:asparagine synthase (glutamine-hydrolyzing) [Chryseosolibacter histidini]MBT1700522.1 asparagine synthase (glutamine-hydrolyzing) [Chryseosolibacter histidini]